MPYQFRREPLAQDESNRLAVSVTTIQTEISLPIRQRLFSHDRLKTTDSYLILKPEQVILEFQQK